MGLASQTIEENSQKGPHHDIQKGKGHAGNYREGRVFEPYGRRVDRKGRISILKHRYHVGVHLAGQTVSVEFKDGLLQVTHHDVVVATYARRHLVDDDHRMDRRAKATRPARPTKGGEVLRKVDPSGSVSFAGTSYRVGNHYKTQLAGVRVVGDTVQITIEGS